MNLVMWEEEVNKQAKPVEQVFLTMGIWVHDFWDNVFIFITAFNGTYEYEFLLKGEKEGVSYLMLVNVSV